MSNILLLEDDLSLINGLSFAFKKQGFELNIARTLKEAEELWTDGKYDLLVLDVSLPDGSGFEFCKRVRLTSKVPIIFLTASDEETSIIMGLDIGGDDYITKPFRPRELIARIGTALRKFGCSPSAFEMCGLYVDTSSSVVKKDGKEVFLSALEYRLLLVFINNPKIILTRDRLLDELWDAAGEFVNNNTLTVYIKRLREKIESDPANPQIILTVRGTGYRLGGRYVSE